MEPLTELEQREYDSLVQETAAKWKQDRMNRREKWQLAKDNNLFGTQLDPNGRLTAEQEEAVEEFIRLSQLEEPDYDENYYNAYFGD